MLSTSKNRVCARAGQIRGDEYQIYYVIGPSEPRPRDHNDGNHYDVVTLWASDGLVGVRSGTFNRYGSLAELDDVMWDHAQCSASAGTC